MSIVKNKQWNWQHPSLDLDYFIFFYFFRNAKSDALMCRQVVTWSVSPPGTSWATIALMYIVHCADLMVKPFDGCSVLWYLGFNKKLWRMKLWLFSDMVSLSICPRPRGCLLPFEAGQGYHVDQGRVWECHAIPNKLCSSFRIPHTQAFTLHSDTHGLSHWERQHRKPWIATGLTKAHCY